MHCRKWRTESGGYNYWWGVKVKYQAANEVQLTNARSRDWKYCYYVAAWTKQRCLKCQKTHILCQVFYWSDRYKKTVNSEFLHAN